MKVNIKGIAGLLVYTLGVQSGCSGYWFINIICCLLAGYMMSDLFIIRQEKK